MKHLLFSLFLLMPGSAFCVNAGEAEPVWPENAPGESAQVAPYTTIFPPIQEIEVPTWEYFPPAEKKSHSCIIVCPGGAFENLTLESEGTQVAEYFNNKGITAVVLRYRVPRREGLPKHLPAWQDLQRTVRIVRSKSEEWGIDSEKIGVLGFSAGGHLALMAATTSETPAYEPADELDRTVLCHVNFAVPVYPACVLDNGADGINANRGEGGTLVDDFAFDGHTPPVCLIHGDEDPISSLGSVAVYEKIRSMGRPCELHIFARTEHGFGTLPADDPNNDHIGDWLNRVWAWMKIMEID